MTTSGWKRAIARRAIALAAIGIMAAFAAPARAFFAGGGKDAEKGNDCLIGYEGVDPDAVTLDGKKPVVTCTDCDPACDHDGVPFANGSCTFDVGVCINQPDVDGCDPAAALDKAQAVAKVKTVKGTVELPLPESLSRSACSVSIPLVVPVRETPQGEDDGSGTVRLSAQVKKDKDAGIEKGRKDSDKLTYVCVPRPAGEACPSESTTTTSFVPTTVSSTSTTSSTSSSTSSSSTTSTSVASTTSTIESTTTTSSSTTSTSTSLSSTTTISTTSTSPSTSSTSSISTSSSITTSTSTTSITTSTSSTTPSTSSSSSSSTSTSSSTTSTSSTTSSSSTASTSQPPLTTTSTTSSTSTTSVPTTTSSTVATTSSTVTSTTTSTTTSTIIPALCGNGALNAGETCDDGNNSDNDGCPANCFIADCTPIAGTVRSVTVSFDAAPNVDVAGLTLLLNYPEQKVFMPPAGPQTQISATFFVPAYPPANVFIRGADLAPAGSTGSGHAVRGVMADSEAVPHGPIFTLKFQDCQGAATPIAGEFNCTVLDASDPFSNPLQGVTCSATLP